MESIYPSSTILSVRRRGVYLEYPSGGCLQASATTRVSNSPVTLGGTGGVSRFFRRIAALSPFHSMKIGQSVRSWVWYG